MNFVKTLSLIAVLATASIAAAAGSASATNLEIKGTAQGGPVTLTASAETSIVLGDTENATLNTCSVSSVAGTTSVFTGEKVTGSLSELSFTTCATSPITVDVRGGLYIIHEAGTTNGIVYSEGASVTVPLFGSKTTCSTPSSGIPIGTLTGVASGNATLSISAVLSCGFLLPSASWSGKYKVTSPTGLGVTNETPTTNTTLEKGGAVQNGAVAITASAESSIVLSDTEGTQANTCSVSSVAGSTSVFTGEKVTGSLSELSFSTCTRSSVTVDLKGGLYIEHEAGTTSGSVYSEGASVTVPTTFGFSVTCTTLSSGTKIGTLIGTGSSSAHATLTISTVLSCGLLLPSASWRGTYKVTSPTGLGVTNGTEPTTQLELAGVIQSAAVGITASAESSITLADTEGSQANTCSVSSVAGTPSVFAGEKVTGSLSELSFTTCTRSPVTVDLKGGLYIEHEAGTTSGSVFSENAEVTVPTTFGFSVTCKTGEGTKIGTLTGVASSSEHATVTIGTVLSCGFLLPSASWKGSYKITSPTGLGVVA